MQALLATAKLSHLDDRLSSLTLDECFALERAELMMKAQEAGAKLPERQAFAKAIAVAKRTQLTRKPPVVTAAPSQVFDISDPVDSSSEAPLLVAWFGAGNSKEQSRQYLEPLLTQVKISSSGRIADALILYLAHEYPSCTTWQEYVQQMVDKIDAVSTSRKLLLFGFSSGAAPCYSVALKLPHRVIKVAVAGMRPVFNVDHANAPPHAEEAFGVTSPEAFRALPAERILRGIADTWVPALKPFANMNLPPTQWSSGVRLVVEHFQRLFCLPFYPGFSTTHMQVYGINPGPTMCAPLLVVSAADEEPHGETPSKVGGWADLTEGAFEIRIVAKADHMSLLAKEPGKGDGEGIKHVAEFFTTP